MSVPPPGPLPPEASSPCPNCGQPWPENAPACPNCGFLRPTGSSWPPAPQGAAVPSPVPPRLVTGKAAGDIVLGLFLSLLSFALAGLGVILMPVLYFVFQPRFPVFARGIGFGWLTGMALILGAVAVCFAVVFKGDL